MAKADPHTLFVTAWRDFGERWLLADVSLVGPETAWFKVCQGTRWWDDTRLPPERPAAPAPPAPPRHRSKSSKRRLYSPPMTVKIPGRFAELVGWPWESNDRLTWWERWHADPKHFGLEPEPLLWWESDLRDEEWPLVA